jgi:hypothetical protein
MGAVNTMIIFINHVMYKLDDDYLDTNVVYRLFVEPANPSIPRWPDPIIHLIAEYKPIDILVNEMNQ